MTDQQFFSIEALILFVSAAALLLSPGSAYGALAWLPLVLILGVEALRAMSRRRALTVVRMRHERPS